jgi:hypothetical protein
VRTTARGSPLQKPHHVVQRWKRSLKEKPSIYKENVVLRREDFDKLVVPYLQAKKDKAEKEEMEKEKKKNEMLMSMMHNNNDNVAAALSLMLSALTTAQSILFLNSPAQSLQ